VIVGKNCQLVDTMLSVDDKINLLSKWKVTSKVNDKVKSIGSGAEVLSHPLKSLTWLLNHLFRRGEADVIMDLQGKYVMTGTCTGLDTFGPGEVFEATFEGYTHGIKVRFS